MLRTPSATRKERFKAALALAKTTVHSWCAERDVTTGHLYQVLNGARESATLTAAVDAFIAEHLPDHQPAA